MFAGPENSGAREHEEEIVPGSPAHYPKPFTGHQDLHALQHSAAFITGLQRAGSQAVGCLVEASQSL